MKVSALLSGGFLQALPEKERQRFGRAGMTSKEAQVKYATGQEIKLQRLCMNWLLLHDIYFEWDHTHKRTRGKRAGQISASVLKGRWISAECKAVGEKLSPEQTEQAARLVCFGGVFLVIFSLEELIKALVEIDSPALTSERSLGHDPGGQGRYKGRENGARQALPRSPAPIQRKERGVCVTH